MILPFQVSEKIVDKPLRIKGVAMSVGMSRNLNIYTAEELGRFAARLEGMPVYVEHVAVPNAVGKVAKTWFDGQRLWYEAEIYDDEIAEKIRKGLIRHVSVAADYERIDFVDGKVPQGLHNAELSLVAVPGFPETNIQVLESLQAADGSGHAPEPPSQRKEGEGLRESSEKTVQRLVTERVWTRRYINSLPDSAFALVLPGGEKDEEGKTKPRSLRMFPHHTADGSIDLPHLRNANARLPQSSLSAEEKEQAMRHLAVHKKKLGIGMAAEEAKLVEQTPEGPIDFKVSPEPTLDELIASIEDVIEQINSAVEGLEARIQKLETPPASEKISQQPQTTTDNIAESLVQKPAEKTLPVNMVLKAVDKTLMAKIPPEWILRSWGAASGGYRLSQDLKRGRRELQETLERL